MNDQDAIRRAYMAFRTGAQLRSEDVSRFLPGLSDNRIRELGRISDRALPITAVDLHALISAWAEELQRARQNKSITPVGGSDMEGWYGRRDELECDQVFRDLSGGIVKLDRRVPGDGTDWYVVEWDGGWFAYDRRIHPGDLSERLHNGPSRAA